MRQNANRHKNQDLLGSNELGIEESLLFKTIGLGMTVGFGNRMGRDFFNTTNQGAWSQDPWGSS
jgi:hypothetical protein